MGISFQKSASKIKDTTKKVSRNLNKGVGKPLSKKTVEKGKKIAYQSKELFSKSEKGSKASLGKIEKNINKKVNPCPALPHIPKKAINKIPESIKGTPEAIALAVDIAVKNKITGNHCWNWIKKIYHMAGCKRRIIFNSVPRYASGKHETINGKRRYVKTPDCGKFHAYKREYSKLKSGDHIFVNNKNKSDNHGNHSEIFLGWVNKSKLIAKTAGYPGGGRPPYVSSRRNFNKTPITWIAKPIPLKKSAPLVA